MVDSSGSEYPAESRTDLRSICLSIGYDEGSFQTQGKV